MFWVSQLEWPGVAHWVSGIATVALNPIFMYVVITNNSSARDVQEHVWLLRRRGRNVKGVRLVGSTIRIQAQVDADPFDSSRKADREVVVRYAVSDGVLGDMLRVSEKSL